MFGKFGQKLSNLFSASSKLDNDLMEQLEELLITSDISYEIVENIISEIKNRNIDNLNSIKQFLKEKFIEILKPVEVVFDVNSYKPFSIIMIGVNGSGKTSTIGKMGNYFSKQNKKVAVVACDTFRLSATEQLKDLVTRTDTLFISKDNSDPSGLAYDGYNKAKSQNCDIIMIDTAGRLGNNDNLMAELSKIIKTVTKIDNNAPSETILVLDGNGGQNSIIQMETFSKNIKITGIILTKTEGSSKSGFIITLAQKYKIPVFFVTFGETLNDIKPFNSNDFVNQLLDL